MAPPMVLGKGLVGRADVLGRVVAALDDARSGAGATVLVEGPAGIGKTSLLTAARRHADAVGMRVLAGRGTKLEHEFAMGVVRQCFGSVIRGHDALFRGAAARAREVVAEVPEGPPGAPEEVLHGLFWLTANLAAEGPLALIIDDAHWADEGSLRFAAYLALRLEALPCTLVVAVRSGEGESLVLNTIRAAAGARVVTLPGLSVEEVQRVLGPADVTFAQACHDATGGNPLLLGELVTALAADGVPFTAAGVPRVAETSVPSLSRRVGMQLAELDPSARALARATAVLGEDVGIDMAAELAGIGGHDTDAAAAVLTGAGLLDDAVPLRFRHPVVATAVRATLSATERARAHARAVELLRARAAGSERIALHLLHVAPAGDVGVVEELREAAALALRRGAPTAAVALLRRALSEPPPAGERAAVLLELGEVEYACGHGRQAALRFEEASREPKDAVVRGRALLALLHTSEWGGLEGMRRLQPHLIDAARRVEQADRELALRLRASVLTSPGLGAAEPAEAHDLAAGLQGATPGEAIFLSSLAFLATWEERSAAEVAALAERAVVQVEAVIAEGAMTELVAGLLLVLRWADRLDLAQRLLDGAVASAQRRGSTADFVIAISQRAAVHRRAGRLREAEADGRAALDAESDPSWWYRGHAAAGLIGTLIDRGRHDEAEQELSAMPGDEAVDSPAHIGLILERVRLRVARRDHAGAVADWEEAVRRASAIRGLSPAWVDDLVVAADAHDGVGDVAAAAALRDQALALARRWGTPGALSVALRARGDHEEAIEHARRSPARLELARALVAHGAVLRRAGRRADSRDPLREGYKLAGDCGAAQLAEFARSELRASGVRLHREALAGRDALTGSERRIAELAAAGASNAEIAQTQFLSIKTVEMHLTRAYRKLDVAGRSELARALA